MNKMFYLVVNRDFCFFYIFYRRFFICDNVFKFVFIISFDSIFNIFYGDIFNINFKKLLVI